MTIAVLGAGLLGSGVALSLAARGNRVVLYDRREAPMMEASRWCEGKVHLGHVYAADPSARTAAAMIRGACSFDTIVGDWVSAEGLRKTLSAPFDYASPVDSQVAADGIEAHFHKVREIIAATPGSYFGDDDSGAFEALDPAREGYSPDRIAALWRTRERAVDTHWLSDGLAQAILNEPLIEFRGGETVESVEEAKGGWRVRTLSGASDGRFTHVANALWANRLVIDAALGLAPKRRWLNRFKFGVNAMTAVDQPAPTVTFVLGSYGDIVQFPNGRAYYSWYPAGMTGMRSDARMIDWRDTRDRNDHERIARESLQALRAYYPALSDFHCKPVVEGGAIFAWGDTDIDDPESELHRRDEIGPVLHGGYVSVNTGKLTTAPLFAAETANMIAARRIRAA